MDAKQALAATNKALKKKQLEEQEEDRLKAKQRRENEEWSRTVGFASFMKDPVRREIAEASESGKKHAVVATKNEIVADLVVEKLGGEKYFVHKKVVYIPENREYGDSGEGMHDAYTEYVIHINWDTKDQCPACEEDFKRSRGRW